MASDDDLSGAYVQDAQLSQQANAAAALMARVKSKRTGAKPAAPGEPPPPAGPGVISRLGSAASAVAGDIAYGTTVDLPRAFANGFRDGVQEMVDLGQSAGKWLDDNVADIDLLASAGLPGAGKVVSEGKLPDPRALVGETESTTGGLIQKGVQFLTGFRGAGKVIKGAGAVASTAKGAAASFAAFDGHEKNLANLWQEAGLPQNTLTDYLASSPDDTEFEGRFKNALTDAGLGTLVEGFAIAGRSLRSARLAKQAPIQAPDAPGAGAVLPQATNKDFQILGDVTQDKVIGKREPVDFGVPDEVAAKGLSGSAKDAAKIGPREKVGVKPHEPEFFINWARINEPDDVKNVMAQMADAFKPELNAARRGKMTFEQIKMGADQTKAWEALAARRVGDPLGAEKAVAARTLWASSANKLTEVAELAATNPSETNLFAFRKMVEVHRTIQDQVVAARTETARALAAWRIPVSSDALRHREISDLISGTGGPEVARTLAERVSAAAKGGRADVVETLAEKGFAAKTSDAVREIWINGLLSGPQTHVVNTVSNAGVLVQQIGERAIAARISRVIGDADGVQFGEAMAQWGGIVDGAKDGMRYAWQMMRTGEDAFVLPGSKLDDARLPAISADALKADPNAWLGRGIDGIGNVIRTPSRALAASDQFFKSIGYRMELNAQAVRLASQEVNAGAIKPDMLKPRIEEILRNPPDTVKLAAADQALYQTFQNKPGEIAGHLLRLKERYPALNAILPFVRTPANIFNYAAQRSPMAPLFSKWRADITAGGARRDLALTRMATGSMLMFTMADMALSGHITGGGPKNPEQKDTLYRTGWQPYSIKAGNSYVAYNRLDPVGLSIGLAADAVEIMHNTEWDKSDSKSAEEVTYAIAAAMANSAMSKSYMEGVANLFTAMANPGGGPNSGGGVKRMVEQLAGSVVPTGVASIERTIDPYLREADGVVQAVKARTPGISDELPLKRDLWGRPISFESGLGWAYDAFSPIYYRRRNPEPIDAEILKQGMNIQMPTRVQSFNGVPYDLDKVSGAYSRFLELAGDGVEKPGFGTAKEFLNNTVQGKSPLSVVYNLRSDGPDGGKESWVKDQLSWYRKAARTQLLEEFPALREEVDERRRRKAELKLNTVRPSVQ